MSDLRLLYTTCPDAAVATTIAETVIGERLAACANLIPGMTSIYRWEGQLQSSAETVLLLKTREARVEACLERVRQLHPYTTPCILVLPIAAAAPAFAAWIADETRKPGAG